MRVLVVIIGQIGFAFDGVTLHVRVLIPGGGTSNQRQRFLAARSVGSAIVTA